MLDRGCRESGWETPGDEDERAFVELVTVKELEHKGGWGNLRKVQDACSAEW